MNVFQAVVLGVVQGITEFLPISSSGHLIFFPKLFGWEEQAIDFDVMIHVATLVAILWVLRKEVVQILMGVVKKKKSGALGWMLLIATLPAAIFGFLLSDTNIANVRTVQVVGVSLIVWGFMLSLADLYRSRVPARVLSVENVTWKQAICIGCAQALALIPGTSRSGITMTAGLLNGQDRKTAARFSFLLAIPAILGAGFLTGLDAVKAGGFATPLPALVAGFLAALISGSLAIRFLLRYLERANFQWFAVYRVVLGVLILLFLG